MPRVPEDFLMRKAPGTQGKGKTCPAKDQDERMYDLTKNVALLPPRNFAGFESVNLLDYCP